MTFIELMSFDLTSAQAKSSVIQGDHLGFNGQWINQGGEFGSHVGYGQIVSRVVWSEV